MALWVRTDASSWVDCHGTSYAEPVKVLSLAISRTPVALDIPSTQWRVSREFETTGVDLDRWTEALNSRFFGKGPKIAGQEWEQLLIHCEAPATNAASCLAEELNHSPPPSPSRYRGPKSKAPLPPVAKLGRNKPFVVASCLDARFLSRLRPFFRLVWMTFFGDLPSEDIARKRFRANANFPDDSESEDPGLGPRERLLEYKAGEGWERVCILLAPSESELSDVPDATTGIEGPGEYLSDTRVLGEKMNKITYGVFQGLGGTVVMQIALVGSVGVSISFAHRNL